LRNSISSDFRKIKISIYGYKFSNYLKPNDVDIVTLLSSWY